MMVKICGITNPEDAAAAVSAGASALGFNFYPKSPRYVSAEKAAELAALLPAGVTRVGVFVNESAEAIAEIARQVPLDVVQLHGSCSPPSGARVWQAVSVTPDFDPAGLAHSEVEAFLLDAPAPGERYGGTGRKFDWDLVRGLSGNIVLAGGLGPDNVAAAIRTVRPWGVDACSRLESAPGKKDSLKMNQFVREAREAEV
jgi:phosphoribosylanthranilate isomerase